MMPNTARAIARCKTPLLAISSGALFCFVFFVRYSNIDQKLYQVRDDGVITMSHARNLVDFGFIGVSPSGDRVEGYSAPVQFFLYALSYGVSGVSYEAFARGQTALFTFLLGAIFVLFFRERPFSGLLLSTLAALMLSHLTSFVEWHASGMENAITHVLFLASVLILFSFSRNERVNFYLAPVIFLAAISRTESIYHIAPVLLIFGIHWLVTRRNAKGLYVIFTVLSLWLIFQIWRWLYFGDVLPNTAYAQNISLHYRIGDWLNWRQDYIIGSIDLAKQIFSYHGGYVLLVFLPALCFVRLDKEVQLLFLLITSLVLTAYLNPFVFGRTSLDPTRSTTQLGVFVALGVTSVIFFLADKRYIKWVAPITAVGAAFVLKVNFVAPYALCCPVTDFEPSRQEFLEVAAKEGLFRPTVANPDLGAMSWHKNFNIVDLGLLGTPIMAKIAGAPDDWRAASPKNGPVLAEYFFEWAAPDLIESHYYWSCRYRESIFEDPRFRLKYQPVREVLRGGNGACDPRKVPVGVWLRKDVMKSSESPERRLIDDLATQLSVERVGTELQRCQEEKSGDCAYVARTVYRFLPEFRAAGEFERLRTLFRRTPTKDYDRYLLESRTDGQAHVAALRLIVERYRAKQAGSSAREPAMRPE